MSILFLSDMDKTLLNSRAQISEGNLSAIAAHVEQGGYFTVATGRPPRSVQIFPRLLPYINMPAILLNGAALWDFQQDTVLEEYLLPPESVEAALEVCRKIPEVGIIAFHWDGVCGILGDNRPLREMVDIREQYTGERVTDLYSRRWNKIILAAEPEKLRLAGAYLERRHPDTAWVLSEPIFLELLPPGVSKGAALKRLLALRGIAPEQVVAMGDGLNDIELLQLAGTGVAIANAALGLKAAADFIFPKTNDEDGVGACLQWCAEQFGV